MTVLSVASRYSDQPEEKVITISRIKDASCPRRYYKNYVEIPRQTKPFESIELGLGQFFHAFLESHLNRVRAEQRALREEDRIDSDDLLRRFRLSFLWEGRLREPYRIVRRNHTLQQFMDRLAAVGRNFNEFLCAGLLGHEIASVEGSLEIRMQECCIRGKHDLVTIASDGCLVLWDWKTGRRPKPQYFEEYEALKSQLGVYATWMRHSYGTAHVRGTAIFLRDMLDSQSEIFTPAIERDILDYMVGWRSRLNGMQTYPAIQSNLCDWCSWNESCPVMRRETKVPTPVSTPRSEHTAPLERPAQPPLPRYHEPSVFRRFWPHILLMAIVPVLLVLQFILDLVQTIWRWIETGGRTP